jgi:putative PIN family toxin of toxin-antitoxin system
MGKEKIVIDTNNLISAFGWEGNSRILLQKVIDGKYSIIMSNSQLLELKRTLKYPKFRFSESQINRFLSIIHSIANFIDVCNEVVISRDPDDNILLDTALVSGSNYIISGDKDLLSIGEYMKIRIMTVKNFLEMKK